MINELKIEMDDNCVRASYQFEFIPAIEICISNRISINVNLEISKSCNYVLFCNFINIELNKCDINDKIKYKHKYATLMPIFLYNAVDCYRFLFGKKIDLNECSWFDDSFADYKNFIGYESVDSQYRNPFHIAIKHHFFDLLKMILFYSSINLNKNEKIFSTGGLATLSFSTEISMTPLNIAIHTDNSNLVRFLLEIRNLDVNQTQSSCVIFGHRNTKNVFSVLKVTAKHENLMILEIFSPSAPLVVARRPLVVL